MGRYSDFKKNKAVPHSLAARIMVIGVGGAGGNTVDHIFELGIKGVNLMNCNTDIKALNKSPLSDTQKICMGDGKGAGNDAAVGRRCAQQALGIIRGYVEAHHPDLIFLTAGMGGGTGTGATPVIAQMIHALGLPIIGIFTTPPLDEGDHRFAQAAAGIQEMQDYIDTFIIIKNETISEIYADLPVKAAFNKANDIVASAAKGIAEIALTQSNLVSVDIADVCNVVRNSHCAIIGMAAAEGKNRIIEAIDAALLSPLFGDASISGSKELLVNFATSNEDDLKMKEVNEALAYLQQIAGGVNKKGEKQRVSVIWGTSVKPELGDKLEIILVVTGFPAETFYDTAFDGRLKITIPEKTVPISGNPDVPAVPVTLEPEEDEVVEESEAEEHTEQPTEPAQEKNPNEEELKPTEELDTKPIQQLKEQPNDKPEEQKEEPQAVEQQPTQEHEEQKPEQPKEPAQELEPVQEPEQPKEPVQKPEQPSEPVYQQPTEPKSEEQKSEKEPEEQKEGKPKVQNPTPQLKQEPTTSPLGDMSWFVNVPERKEPAIIQPKVLDNTIIDLKRLPAYQRRNVNLMTDIKGKKVYIGKRNDDEDSKSVVDGSTQSLGF